MQSEEESCRSFACVAQLESNGDITVETRKGREKAKNAQEGARDSPKDPEEGARVLPRCAEARKSSSEMKESSHKYYTEARKAPSEEQSKQRC